MIDPWLYIDAAYGLCVGGALWLGLAAALRLRRARRALARFEAS